MPTPVRAASPTPTATSGTSRPREAGEPCCQPVGTALDDQDAVMVAAALKVVADPTRVRLLSLIASSPSGEVCVCDLTAPLGLTQPTISHHLKVLLEAGVLQRDKRGVWAYYRLVPASLTSLGTVVSSAFTDLTAVRPAPTAARD